MTTGTGAAPAAPGTRFADGEQELVRVWLWHQAPPRYQDRAAAFAGDADYLIASPQRADSYTAECIADVLGDRLNKITFEDNGLGVALWVVGRHA